MEPDPQLLEFLELLQDYIRERGYALAGTTEDGNFEAFSTMTLMDFYRDWLADQDGDAEDEDAEGEDYG